MPKLLKCEECAEPIRQTDDWYEREIHGTSLTGGASIFVERIGFEHTDCHKKRVAKGEAERLAGSEMRARKMAEEATWSPLRRFIFGDWY